MISVSASAVEQAAAGVKGGEDTPPKVKNVECKPKQEELPCTYTCPGPHPCTFKRTVATGGVIQEVTSELAPGELRTVNNVVDHSCTYVP